MPPHSLEDVVASYYRMLLDGMPEPLDLGRGQLADLAKRDEAVAAYVLGFMAKHLLQIGDFDAVQQRVRLGKALNMDDVETLQVGTVLVCQSTIEDMANDVQGNRKHSLVRPMHEELGEEWTRRQCCCGGCGR